MLFLPAEEVNRLEVEPLCLKHLSQFVDILVQNRPEFGVVCLERYEEIPVLHHGDDGEFPELIKIEVHETIVRLAPRTGAASFESDVRFSKPFPQHGKKRVKGCGELRQELK